MAMAVSSLFSVEAWALMWRSSSFSAILQRGHVDGEARLAVGQGDLVDVERPHGAADHRMGAADETGPRAGIAAVEPRLAGNLQAAIDGGADVGRLHRGDIGLVHPGELAVGLRAARSAREPHRARRSGAPPACPACGHRAASAVDLAPLARQRAEAQRGETAGGAAIGLEQFARAGADADVEGPVPRRAARPRARPVPVAESRSSQAAKSSSASEVCGNFGGPMHGAADAFGRAVAAAPDDEHMGLGRNGGLRLVELGFEFGDAAPGRHVVARHAADDEERPDDHRRAPPGPHP